jgi:hypothetical protein
MSLQTTDTHRAFRDGYDDDMSESTYPRGERMPGDPQVTGGGGHEPDPDQARAGGVGAQDEQQGSPAPDAGAGFDLKSSELPDPHDG